MFDPSSAEIWAAYADRSYVASRLLWFTSLWLECPVQGHRTMELYLKGFLVGQGIAVAPQGAWGHNLSELYDRCVQADPEFASDDVSRRLSFLNRYFDYVRYPSEPGSPEDGSLVWFSFESNLLVLDQLVAYVRPRIHLEEKQWAETEIAKIALAEGDFRRKALEDGNESLQLILCDKTRSTNVSFSDFRFDEEGC